MDRDKYQVVGLDKSTMEDPLFDRILGTIYGSVLGDAFEQILKAYGTNPIPFPGFLKTSHNSRWPKGDWTDESDQMIIALESLLETNGKACELNFAKKLQKWVVSGFSDLGDTCGLGSTSSSIILQSQFVTNPFYISEKTWVTSGRRNSNNGAISRAIATGLFQYDKMDIITTNSTSFCKTTHFDQRCITSNNAISYAIAILLNNIESKRSSLNRNEEVDHLIEEIVAKCANSMTLQERVEFEEIMYNTSLESLNLSAPDSISYVFKSLGAGFWGLRSNYSFKDTLNMIVKEGGDSDSNGSIAGGLLGCKIGYSHLPKDWIQQLPNKEWLDIKVLIATDDLYIMILAQENYNNNNKNNNNQDSNTLNNILTISTN
ncbi:hypothetical protein PPL_06734 [Heterostelium album PN500]|uniref:ADP-ribosylglycohydrolase n=1 Tax=Heterostelium pallidum (strain ATCC 26659 / Pp 5 / PN500) TaxID=670386 RepID=D3BFK0_HETP5|nr:hypothetical protein PPL_06734 [Heterostelium album PN500]EFA79914.1 hypothetical protein PPL_06734 [Heterostelium album PN500]|eukprot:XP_020432035.1 hypothetical protein PPL_06734 [Heterostelium album PN500]